MSMLKILLVIAGLAGAGSAFGEEAAAEAPIARSYAVVIGISEYPEYPPLPVAVPDAMAIADLLREKGYTEVLLMTNAQATKANIQAGIQAITAKLQQDDLFGLFFAGHGMRIQSGSDAFAGYLIPVDGRKGHEAEDGFAMHAIQEAIARMPNTHIGFYIDACHSGFLADSIDAAGEAGVLSHHVRVFTAASEDEVAFEAGAHGLFTQLLLDHAQTDRRDTESAAKTADKVTRKMRADTGGWQTPRFVEVQGHRLRVLDGEK